MERSIIDGTIGIAEDIAEEKAIDKMKGFVKRNNPINYSSFVKNYPDLTQNQIKNKMSRIITRNHRVSVASEYLLKFGRGVFDGIVDGLF